MGDKAFLIVTVIVILGLVYALVKLAVAAERDKIRIEQAKQKKEDDEAIEVIINDIEKLDKSEAADRLRKLKSRMQS